MKSLEIVDKKINYCEKQEVPFISIRLVSLQQIKVDLEVLEIIRKKDVNLATIKLCIMRTDTIEQLLSKYNKSRYFTQDELTMEELLKIKQWLEENE